MKWVVVADTGPLIALARVTKLDLLRRLYGCIVVPPAVQFELAIDSAYPGASVISAAFKERWIVVQPDPDPVVTAELAGVLDPGEAQAISLAEQPTTRFLLIDDAKGRKIARRRGIPVVGVAGVLLAAKSEGMLALVAPVLRDLSRAGYRLSSRLIDGVLKQAGE